MEYFIVGTFWTLYCVLHSYLISIHFTSLMRIYLKRYYAFYRLFYVLISLALIVPLIRYSAGIDSTGIITYSLPLNSVRLGLIAASLAIFFWTFFFSYDPLSFFGIRQIMNREKGQIKATKELSRKGLLGVVRHPIYTALIVCLWCQIFTIKDILVNTILTIYVIIGTILEERKLVLEFGNAYLKYQQQVPMLIPFFKLKDSKPDK